jgi:hypothetical protein
MAQPNIWIFIVGQGEQIQEIAMSNQRYSDANSQRSYTC